jgi:DMSO/TMAO reductase YedYZ molybdopterin-dependent catalytic subunit
MTKTKYLLILGVSFLVLLVAVYLVNGAKITEPTFLYPANPDIKFLNEHRDFYQDRMITLKGKTEVPSSGDSYFLDDSTGKIEVILEGSRAGFIPDNGTAVSVTGRIKKTSIGGGCGLPSGSSVGPYGISVPAGSNPSCNPGISKEIFFEVKRERMDGSGTMSSESAEIRSFDGKDLSSVEDFRDNAILGTQNIDINNYRLTITGLTNKKIAYTYDEILQKYPHVSKIATLNSIDGWNATVLWEGVLVRDLIADAGPETGADTVIFTGRDGLTTSLPLSYFMQHDIIMAYKMNGITLPHNRGYPFILVAEDKWDYKWIQWIEKIELSDNPSYRGYWESRGYSNSGDFARNPLNFD